MKSKNWIVIGAVVALCGVALGAFGAHGLKSMLSSGDLDVSQQIKLLHDWDVAARYQMYHALAILAVGIVAQRSPNRWLHAAGALFCIGVLIFSGGLYVYVLTGAKLWAMIVPIGGVAFLIGWFSFAIGAARGNNRLQS